MAMSKVVREVLAQAKAYAPAPDASPNDIATETAGIADGVVEIDAFVAEHREALTWLIQCYPDDIAQELLEALREDFWSGSFAERKRQ